MHYVRAEISPNGAVIGKARLEHLPLFIVYHSFAVLKLKKHSAPSRGNRTPLHKGVKGRGGKSPPEYWAGPFTPIQVAMKSPHFQEKF